MYGWPGVLGRPVLQSLMEVGTTGPYPKMPEPKQSPAQTGQGKDRLQFHANVLATTVYILVIMIAVDGQVLKLLH